ncbi:alpha/beta-hydrolase [Serendipita vermifera]|nr:alpha/beta-hydrolase [Serendipita vermifera]
MTSLQTFAKGTFASAVGLSTLSLGLLYYGQNYLIYPAAFPPGSRIDVPTPADYGLPYEDLVLDTSDGIKIKCYLLVQRRALPGESAKEEADVDTAEEDRKYAGSRPTVLMFHGNGGNIGHRVPLARIFYSKMRCNVMLVSYRGYGQSEGSPSEQGFMIDSQTALDYVRADPALTSTPVICYGQSIGGAVSISLASRNPDAIKGLILENTFLSIPRLIPSAVPLLSPFAWLCHQKWDSATAITKIPRTTPMIFLSGKQDEIVPHEHMQMLWQITTEKCNPDGTLKTVAKPPEAAATNTGGWLAQALGFGGTSSASTTDDKPERPEEEDHADAGDPDLKEYANYEIVDDKEVLVSKRTRYRVWKEFEDGKHNDTCIQQGYWSAVWDFVDSIVPIPA